MKLRPRWAGWPSRSASIQSATHKSSDRTTRTAHRQRATLGINPFYNHMVDLIVATALAMGVWVTEQRERDSA